MKGTLLVTGGAGYIGSHVLAELIAAGYRPIALDDLSNGSRRAVERVEALTGMRIPFFETDIREPGRVRALFELYRRKGDPVECVVHLAGCKAVAESVADPLKYYQVNVAGTAALLSAMRQCGVRRMVFSSSATVYGAPVALPITEAHPLAPASPYGHGKLAVEQMLRDLCAADREFGAVVLRYFNPIGAHPSGRIGEAPHNVPANLFPYLTQVAVRRRSHLTIFGADYDTPDGTGVRDYLHVMDLARGHVSAVDRALAGPGCLTVNLGTGSGTSVRELVHAFERVTGRRIPCAIAPRRDGDVAAMWADPGRALRELGWRAERTLDDMCADGWRWQRRNPAGYADSGAPAAPSIRPGQRGHARPRAAPPAARRYG